MRAIIRFVVIILLGGTFFVLQHNGLVWFNMPSQKAYPIKGVDVSAHQGQIDWQILASQNLSFVFMKATEGSSWVDKKFAYNFENAHKYGLYVGAYHFFSFESGGETQAQNFIRNVPQTKDGQRFLPPVVDIEFYGSNASHPPSVDSVRAELHILLQSLQEHYGLKPIIYTTSSFYDVYYEGSMRIIRFGFALYFFRQILFLQKCLICILISLLGLFGNTILTGCWMAIMAGKSILTLMFSMAHRRILRDG